MSFDEFGFDEIQNKFDALTDPSAMAEKMLKAGAKPILREMKSKTKAPMQKGYATGGLEKSIKTKNVQKAKDGWKIVTTAEGTNSKGVRYNEILAYLTYGTVNMDAEPVIAPALSSAKSEAISEMEKVFNQEMNKNG